MSVQDRLAGRRVVASISGGKDSAALSLHLAELGIEHDRIFFDTGWEHPDTYAYLRGPLTAAIGPIRELHGPRTMAELCIHKGMFPMRTKRFCTSELKMRPAQDYIAALMDGGTDVVNAVGIRAGESRARSLLTEWEWSDGWDCEIWRPLIAWSEADVIAVHRRHGLAPNPLYLRGYERVGCWPCIFARKDEIRRIADESPERIAEIRALEATVNDGARARAAAKGEPLRTVRAWFMAMGSLRGEVGDCTPVPIDDAVSWARTARGGRQFELFAPEHEAGCVRWGLCDTGGAR